MKSKVIVALIGKAGAGKDTIAKALCSAHPEFNNIVSCTTRPKRENEVEGVDYFYLTSDQFAEKVINGDMLEATYFNGWHYGTMLSSLKDGVNIGVFNPEGLDCLYQGNEYELFAYQIHADDKTRILRQLNRENNPNVKEICRRFIADEEDFMEYYENADNLPALLINEVDEHIPYIVQFITKELQDVGIID